MSGNLTNENVGYSQKRGTWTGPLVNKKKTEIDGYILTRQNK
jgi:hypothetical protein